MSEEKPIRARRRGRNAGITHLDGSADGGGLPANFDLSALSDVQASPPSRRTRRAIPTLDATLPDNDADAQGTPPLNFDFSAFGDVQTSTTPRRARRTRGAVPPVVSTEAAATEAPPPDEPVVTPELSPLASPRSPSHGSNTPSAAVMDNPDEELAASIAAVRKARKSASVSSFSSTDESLPLSAEERRDKRRRERAARMKSLHDDAQIEPEKPSEPNSESPIPVEKEDVLASPMIELEEAVQTGPAEEQKTSSPTEPPLEPVTPKFDEPMVDPVSLHPIVQDEIDHSDESDMPKPAEENDSLPESGDDHSHQQAHDETKPYTAILPLGVERERPSSLPPSTMVTLLTEEIAAMRTQGLYLERQVLRKQVDSLKAAQSSLQESLRQKTSEIAEIIEAKARLEEENMLHLQQLQTNSDSSADVEAAQLVKKDGSTDEWKGIAENLSSVLNTWQAAYEGVLPNATYIRSSLESQGISVPEAHILPPDVSEALQDIEIEPEFFEIFPKENLIKAQLAAAWGKEVDELASAAQSVEILDDGHDNCEVSGLSISKDAVILLKELNSIQAKNTEICQLLRAVDSNGLAPF